MNLKKSCIINGLNDQGRRVKLEFKKNLYDQTAKSETNQPRFFFSSAFSMIANTMIVYQHTSAQSTLGSTNFALSRSCTYIHKRTRCALCTDGRHVQQSVLSVFSRYFPGIFPLNQPVNRTSKTAGFCCENTTNHTRLPGFQTPRLTASF